MFVRWATRPLGVAALAWFAGSGCRESSGNREIVVFGAASLSSVFREIETEFEKEHPGLHITFEPSGSQIAVRKITELGRRADLVASSDWRLLEGSIVPDRADGLVQIASDELVLAYTEHSRFADEITCSNWRELLLEPEVRLGRVNEHTAPLGYQTLLSFRLAGLHFAGDPNTLASEFVERSARQPLATDAEELAALLATKTIDYGFLYRSLAESHRLRVLALPADINLGSPALEDRYAKAHFDGARSRPGEARSLPGAAILVGIAPLRDAPNPQGAESLLAFVLGPSGRALLARAGYTPLQPARVHGPGPAASELAARVAGESRR